MAMSAKRLWGKLKEQWRLTYLLWGLLLVSAVFSALSGEWGNVFLACVVGIVSLLPFAFEYYSGLVLPKSFIAAVVFFIVATLFLGEVYDFYNRFWWWDTVLHTASAIGFGLIGFVFVFSLIGMERQENSAWVVALLSFAFAMMIGALWEIFEFGMDEIFGLNMQKSGLDDTMWDLIVDALGALIAAFSGWLVMRKRRGLSLFTGVLKEFFVTNREFFKSRRARKRAKGETSE